MKYIYFLMMTIIVVWLGGLFYFIYGLSHMAMPTDEKTDGIVVLTGGKNRLQEAVRLLENEFATRLFISGVNASVTEDELFALLGSSKKLSQCCIESGTAARNTVGNAREIAQWVAANNIASIRVVTSLEHMPRSLVEMRRLMPHIRMIAHPVGQWRPGNIRIFSLIREYSKYLTSIIRTGFFPARPVDS